MYKTDISILDWAALLAKYSYTAITFLIIQLVVMTKNIHLGGQRLLAYHPERYHFKQMRLSGKKSALENHVWNDLYLTKSTAQKRSVRV